MEKEFVPFKLAVKLKEVGFDEPCFYYFNSSENNQLWQDTDGGYYRNSVIGVSNLLWDVTFDNGNVSAPLWSQCFDWFREKHNLTAEQSVDTYRRRTDKKWMYSITWLNEDAMYMNSKITYTTYEEARQACLEKLIEIVESERS